ncbi:transporter substrate-binding domain-containing protein [Paraburkholderia antibiotica]|uniref:transporter substrate-binding domain-containing protein n=1 Tax=Paraburkholderia antibiotica TaxID=2728839 RepID=UPI0038B2988E
MSLDTNSYVIVSHPQAFFDGARRKAPEIRSYNALEIGPDICAHRVEFAGPAVSDEKLLGAGVGYGVRKNDKALKDALNGALKDLKADGTIDRLAAKYFDVKVVLK